MSTAHRRARRFSENFKIEKVREIEKGQTKITDIAQSTVSPTLTGKKGQQNHIKL